MTFLCLMKASPNEIRLTVPGLGAAGSLSPFSFPFLVFVVLCLLQVLSFRVGGCWTCFEDFPWQMHTSDQ